MQSTMKVQFEVQQKEIPSYTSPNESQEIIRRMFTFSHNIDLELPFNVIFVFSNGAELSSKEVIDLVIDNKFTRIFDKPARSEDAKKIQMKDVMDMEPNAFINLLRYIYTDPTELLTDFADLSSTYLAALRLSKSKLIEKWVQQSFKRVCDKLLRFTDKHMLPDNAITIFDQYMKLGDLIDAKVDDVAGVINLHTYIAVQSPGFANIGKETLVLLLESNELFVKEKDLYYATLRWVRAELLRQKKEVTLENKRRLFNEFKHLIRFPIMSKTQFFNAERMPHNEKKEFEFCPAKSGFFTETELKEFEAYFESKDPKVLSVNYKTEERARQYIGRLKLIKNQAGELEYEMSTDVDDLYGKNESGYNVNEAETVLMGCGDNLESVQDENNKEIKTKKIRTRQRKENLICSGESIKVFRFHTSGDDTKWMFGEHPMIYENGKFLNIFYKRYCIDNLAGYFDFYPSFELKKDCVYDFKFVCPGEGSESTKMKLENIYSTNAKGETVLDVKLRIIGKLSNAHAHKIFFLYKRA